MEIDPHWQEFRSYYWQMKRFESYAGHVKASKCRLTGRVYSLYKADEAGFDDAGGNWVVVCEDHGTLCNFPTRRQAEAHLPAGDWCEACMEGWG